MPPLRCRMALDSAGGPHLGSTTTRAAFRFLLPAAFVAIVFFVLGWLYPQVLTIFAGALLGILLHGLALGVAGRTRWDYRAVVGSLVVLLVVAIALAIWLVGPALADQIEQLFARVPAALTKLRAVAARFAVLRYVSGSPPSAADLVNKAAGFVKVGFEGLAGAAIALVIGIYGAFDPCVYERAFLALVPPARRGHARDILQAVSSTLMRWVIGRAVVMILVGLITSVGLWISRVPVPMALGLISGVMTFIPYLGVILSIVPALLVALSSGPWAMLWVVVVFGIAHGLEGYVLVPLIAKHTVEFPPAFTIGVQILLGAAWGILGFTFATPIAVVVTKLIRTLYVEDYLEGKPLPAPSMKP